MTDYKDMDIKIFKKFSEEWALVSAGSKEHFNSCTISWGSMGTLWTRPGKDGSVITVYIHPSRYTCELLKENDTFTVSFFDQKYKRALGYLGSRSGRNENKIETSGLTPIPIGNSVTYEEANLTFLCRKVYSHQLSKEDIADDVKEYYLNNPKVYPADENGEWQPHYLFIGEIIEIRNKQ